METVLAVDIGGTKIAAGVVSPEGSLLRSATRATPKGDDAEVAFAAVVATMTEVADGEEVAVGVGCGGPMTIGGEAVSPLNIPAWRGFPLRRRVADAWRLEVHVDNDAKALALGEGWVGVARGVNDFIAMVVSTGVGGGVVLDGRLLNGAAGNAGHIGHVIVEPQGRLCVCGARGCLEAEASGTAIAARTGRPAAEATSEERRRSGCMVGRAVASVANLLDLRLAVIAGSVALGYGEEFFSAAQEEVDRSARLDFSVGTRVVPAGLAEEGPLIGAAAVAWRAMGRDVGVA